MKKNIIRNIDPFHDEIEIDREPEINFEIYSQLKETPQNKIDLTEEFSKLDDHNQSAVNEKENCKSTIGQDLSREKARNIPHEARYSIQLEKTKALNAQHGSIFLKSPKEDRRSDATYKMNKSRSLVENISNNLPKQSTSSEAINQEFFKRFKPSPESQPTHKTKRSKTLKCRNSMKISSRRNFSKNKKLLSLRKSNIKSLKNQSNMSLTMKEIVEEISAALFDSEEFVKKFQNLVNITTKDSKKLLENEIAESKLVYNFNSKENSLKKTENSDSTDFNAKIYKTRQPETIIHELMESIKERYRHHSHLPAKFIFPIIYDEPDNLIHKYEFLTYETYLKTSVSCDPNYKMIGSNRIMTPSNLEIPEKKVNTNEEEKLNNWDDSESSLVINEEVINEELPTINTLLDTSENLTNQLQSKRIPCVLNNNSHDQSESTIDSISVHESQNRKTPNVNIILKAPSVIEKNLPEPTIPVNLSSHILEKPEIKSTSMFLKNNEFNPKLINQIDGNNNIRSSKMRKLEIHKGINYNDLHLKQIEQHELKRAMEYKRAFTNLMTNPHEYNKNSTTVQNTKAHNTESLNHSNYIGAGNFLTSNSFGNQQQPMIRNNYSNPVREQIHPSSVNCNHPQFPINLMVDPPGLNGNGGIEHGLNFMPQIAQSKISVSHPKYPLMPNTDAKILEYRLQHSSPIFQPPCNLSTQTHDKIFNCSRNNPQRQCLQVNAMISQQPMSSNLDSNSRAINNELIQHQQNSQFNLISQVNYQSQAPALANNRQHTAIDPGVSNHVHSSLAAQNHFNQQKFYYGAKESHQFNYNQNYPQQCIPHNGNSSRNIPESQLKRLSTK